MIAGTPATPVFAAMTRSSVALEVTPALFRSRSPSGLPQPVGAASLEEQQVLDPEKRESSRPTVHNEAAGATSGTVLQAGSIHGDVHLNSPQRSGPSWPVTGSLIAFATAIPLAMAVWSIDSRNPLTIAAGAAIVAGGLLAVGWFLWKRTRGPSSPHAALNRLRTQVRTQWSDETSRHGLRRPNPLRLRWRPTSISVERAYTDTEQSDAELMRGELVRTAGDLSSAHALATAFQAMSRRQLVVLGPPGAGKSTLAALFTLALIEQDTGPVPVLLSVAGWDPAERIEDWCARHIAQDYPDFVAKGGFGPDQVTSLLLNRHIVPVLDGLDEMPRPVLSTALADLDRAAEIGLRMVVTCRSAEFEQAVHDRGALAHAAVVDIEPIRVEDTIAYLTEAEVANSHRWSAVIEQVRKEPSGPLAQALSTPLMISLARSIYQPPSRNPGKLTEFTTASQIMNHLLEEYLPTALRGDDHKNARKWLSFLSKHLQEQGDPNFEWWNLARSVPRWLLLLLITLASMAYGSLLLGLCSSFLYPVNAHSTTIEDFLDGSFFGAILGAAAGFLGGLRAVRHLGISEMQIPRRKRFGVLNDSLSDICTLIIVLCLPCTLALLMAWLSDRSLMDGIAFTVAMTLFELRTFNSESWLDALRVALLAFQVTLVINVLGSRAGTPKRSTPNMRRLLPSMASGMMLGLACMVLWFALDPLSESWDREIYALIAIMIGVPLGIVRWLAVPVEDHRASSPMSVLRSDRTALLSASLSSGVLTALGMGLLYFPESGEDDSGVDLSGIIGQSCTVGLVIMMVVVVGSGSAWVPYTITRLWLACRGELPWGLMRFLRTAHEKGVLRQVGPAYQLRHELLRTHLAGQWPSEQYLPPVRWFVPRWSGARQRSRTRVLPWRYRTVTLATAVFATGAASVPYFDDDLLPIGWHVSSVVFNHDGTLLATGSHDGIVRLWDLTEDRPTPTTGLDHHNDLVDSVVFDHDGTLLATVSDDGTAQLWDLTEDEPTPTTLDHHNDWVNSVAFSHDGTLLATAGDNGTAQLWDLTEDRPTPTTGLDHHNHWVDAVAFNHDSTLLATGTSGMHPDGTYHGTAQVWDLTEGDPIPTITLDHNHWVNSVVFNHDSTLLATVSNDGTAQLWDLTEDEPTPTTLDHHNDWVNSVAFNHDGTLLATGTSNTHFDGTHHGTAQLWDLTEDEPTPTILTPHNDLVNSVAFNHDGSLVATGGSNGTARLWPVPER